MIRLLRLSFAWKFFKWALTESSPENFNYYFDVFDEFLNDFKGDKQTKLDVNLLKELKEILINPSLVPSEILKSFLHLEQSSDRFYLYSHVITQIYNVITK